LTAVAVPDTTTAANWLHHFYAGVDDGWLTLFAVDRTTGDKVTRWAKVTDIDALADHALELAETSCVWFGVATRTANLGGRRGGGADCAQITALWVDIDVESSVHAAGGLPPTIDAAHEILDDFPLPPSAVVHSGHGLQAWWMLTEPLDASDATSVLADWGTTWAELGRRRGWHIDNVFDVARVMRLPGTYNRKADPVPVDVIEVDWARTYGTDDIAQHTLDAPEPDPAIIQRRNVPYIGPERPGDAYNATADPRQILERAGFHRDKTDHEGNTHYRAPHRPGKNETTGATVYADGHTTIWSETFARQHGMEVRRPYDPFGLTTHIEHDGDWVAATSALRASGYGSPAGSADLSWIPEGDKEVVPGETGATLVELAHIVDWTAFWAADHTSEEWLAYPLVPAGRAIALYAPAKAGKSTIVLAAVAAAATGRPIFGGGTATDPVDVLYLDYEMTEADLEDRLTELGYGPDVDMSHLHYALLPSIPPLDTKAGAAHILALAEHCNARLVVVDTFGRAVEGEENEADTVRAFYRHTGLALKAAGRSVLRTDHSGKDTDKGQRGSSAKNDDVDVVWSLTRSERGVRIQRTHSRISWVPQEIALQRVEGADGVVRYEMAEQSYVEGTAELARLLDELGVPIDASRKEAGDAIRSAGRKVSNNKISDAQRWRKAERPQFVSDYIDSLGAAAGIPADFSTGSRPESGPGAAGMQKPRSDTLLAAGAESGQTTAVHGAKWAPLKGATGPDHTFEHPEEDTSWLF
jgi:hypothetical protein